MNSKPEFSEKQLIQLSKFISLVLRHKPETIDLKLDENGWARVDELLKKSKAHGRALDLETLRYIVENNNKKRFAFSEDGRRIRASQGHSVDIDLQLEPLNPPEILWHGTATKTISIILKEGLKPMSRQHVHLSADPETAQRVGQRHGKPVMLQVAAAQMAQEGHLFYRSENGVWLTDFVDRKYLKTL